MSAISAFLTFAGDVLYKNKNSPNAYTNDETRLTRVTISLFEFNLSEDDYTVTEERINSFICVWLWGGFFFLEYESYKSKESRRSYKSEVSTIILRNMVSLRT